MRRMKSISASISTVLYERIKEIMQDAGLRAWMTTLPRPYGGWLSYSTISVVNAVGRRLNS